MQDKGKEKSKVQNKTKAKAQDMAGAKVQDPSKVQDGAKVLSKIQDKSLNNTNAKARNMTESKVHDGAEVQDDGKPHDGAEALSESKVLGQVKVPENAEGQANTLQINGNEAGLSAVHNQAHQLQASHGLITKDQQGGRCLRSYGRLHQS